ncbi:MAG: AMP-binding protein [Gemmatimonadetes bacterium]|nr:AMP-binding protein [Gemmatimonadota bacterium]
MSEPLAGAIEEIRSHARFLEHLVVVGGGGGDRLAFDELLSSSPAQRPVAETNEDDLAFWLYTWGTTGQPKAAIHLQYDTVVCCEAFGRHVLEIAEQDRCFSIAKVPPPAPLPGFKTCNSQGVDTSRSGPGRRYA